MNYIHFHFGQHTVTPQIYTYCICFFFYSHRKCVQVMLTVLHITIKCCCMYIRRYFTCTHWCRNSFTLSSFLSNGTRYICFILMWCLLSTLSIVEMLTDWMFWKTLLSSIMALCISLSLMALFALTMVQIASSCWGVQRGPLPPL